MESPNQVAKTLARAERHVLLSGADDAAERLCRLNMRYGLAKIHHFQQSRGWEPDALFIGAPDATVTRNPGRWLSGFGYGGLLRWSGDFVPLEAKPNGCGLLMVGLERNPKQDVVAARLERLERQGLSVDDRKISFDIRHSNHFAELCHPDEQARAAMGWTGPVALIHSSGSEFRGPTELGPGLYWDESPALKTMALQHETPWGPLWVVEGAAARTYQQETQRVHLFQMDRRLALAQALFGKSLTVLFHGMHQGLIEIGTIALGCYLHDGNGNGRAPFVQTPAKVFPVTLSADLPIWLIEGLPALSDQVIDSLGWDLSELTKTARGWLNSAHLVPHGGGTAFPTLTDVSVTEQGARRLFSGLLPDGPVEFRSCRDLPFSYRGEDVARRAEALGLGRKVGTMDVDWWIGAKS